MPRAFASGINPALLARHGLTPPAKATQKARRAVPAGERPGDRAERALWASLALLGIPHEPQYAWGRALDPPRRFRSDAALPAHRILIEIDGGVHGIGEKRARDLERQNLAVRAGWRVYRFLPAQAEDGTAALFVAELLAQPPSDSDKETP